MVKILELPSVRRQARPIDVRTYHWMGENGLADERTELLRGVIVEKMSKSPLHSFVVNRLIELLSSLVNSGLTVRKEDPLTLDDSEPEPDVAVIHGALADFKNQHPNSAELVIEVAISSTEVDREKATIYAEAGVKEYWLVLPQEKIVEIFSDPADGRYRNHTVMAPGETATSTIIPEFGVNLAELIEG